MKKKTKEEILKQAKELCNRKDAECALFISGYVAGYEACQDEQEAEK